MMKFVLPITLTLLMISCTLQQAFGQGKVDTITLTQGEILDILWLSQNPDTKADFQAYVKDAFPVARGLSYQPLPGFRVVDHAQGNHRPSSLILAKWSNITLRETFLNQILDEVGDFHERRRKIWSYFGLCYFEIEEELTLEIHRDHYHIATAYWLVANSLSSNFYEKWKAEIQASRGEILVQLTDGISPFGYEYNPEYLVITSWPSEAAFQEFQDKISELERDNIRHVNELILE